MATFSKKICIISTIPYPLQVFMKPHIERLSQFYEITLIANGQSSDFNEMLDTNVKFINLAIERKISLLKDVAALVKLYRILCEGQYDVVHSLMPKTSLLGMTAAFMARVPVRIHTFTGQVWANQIGLPRFLFKKIDQLVAACATNILTDSASQKQFLIDQKIVSINKIKVLGNGSVCGVNVNRFKPDIDARQKLRLQYGINESATVFMFLGRINQEKGVLDLANAFLNIASNHPDLHLFIVGPDESGVSNEVHDLLQSVHTQYHRVDLTSTPELLMSAADVFCLPSYREGFGSVLIEAAATGLPTIASNIYGITDAVIDGETGILHEPKNIGQIEAAMLTLLNDCDLRSKMGLAGKLRAINDFSTQHLVDEMLKYYTNVLNKK